MNIIIFEDKACNDLKPLTINHASFEVKTGLMSNLDRFKLSFKKEKLFLVVRPEIEEIIRERYPTLSVNPDNIPSGYCINGKIVWKNEYKDTYLNEKDYSKDNALFIYRNKHQISLNKFIKKINSKVITSNKHSLQFINYLWDAIELFNMMIDYDTTNYSYNLDKNRFDSIHCIESDKINVGNKTIIRAGSILDAEKGPIIIGDNVYIDIGSKIQGPVFIADNAYISPGANIRSNCLIGNGCKVGGEISNTIFHGNSNKVHDGFIGHSYICEWVNIGAGTNNSNLKNNYSFVKFDFGSKIIDTKRTFLGTMIGDYSRIGISTMLNTGTYIGLGGNIFGGNFKKKYNKSFCWGDNDTVDLDKFIKTCLIMKKRRDEKLSLAEKQLIKKIYFSKT